MPMSKTVLGPLLKAAVDTAVSANPTAGEAQRDAIFEEMAGAIIAHIQSAAVVTTVVTVASVSGVTVGAGVSGPGAGTGTGTIA